MGAFITRVTFTTCATTTDEPRLGVARAARDERGARARARGAPAGAEEEPLGTYVSYYSCVSEPLLM